MARYLTGSPIGHLNGLIDQLVRSPALQAGGREFESRSVHFCEPSKKGYMPSVFRGSIGWTASAVSGVFQEAAETGGPEDLGRHPARVDDAEVDALAAHLELED